MTEFQGIPIDERVLTLNILFACIFLVVFLVLLFVSIRMLVLELIGSPANRKKQQHRIKSLQERAKTDPIAERALAHCMRKQEKRMKKRRRSAWVTAFLPAFVLLGLIVCVIVFLSNYQDYTKKDYAVYTGTFEMQYGNRGADWIVLPDGTMLEENGSIFEEGTYTGTVVYGKRAKVVVGIEWE